MNKRYLLWGFLAPLLGYGLFFFCHKQTEGFQLTKVLSTLPPSTQWELPPPTPQEQILLEERLKEPFFYLDKGGQSFVFLSQDGRTILKLFKMHNLNPHTWAYSLFFPSLLDHLRLRLLLGQKEKLLRTFGSSHLAYTQLKEETGLLYLSLNPQPALKGLSVTLVDKLGIAHSVPLEHLPFALQQRAERALTHIKRCVKQGNIDQAQECLHQMLLCLKHRHERGIVDVDPALKRNMGFAQGKALFIDIGGFFPATSTHPKDELSKELSKLRRWTLKHAPDLTSFLEQDLRSLQLS